jgi:hypothetical protein
MTNDFAANPYMAMLLQFDPSRVYGWEQEVMGLLQNITQRQSDSHGFYGLRAAGKTTFLRYLQHPKGAMIRYRQVLAPEYVAGKRRLLWVYISFHYLQDDSGIFLLMYEQLYESLAVTTFITALDLPAPDPYDAESNSYQTLLDAVKQLQLNHMTRVVFLMDDFDVALKGGDVSLEEEHQLRFLGRFASMVIMTEEPVANLNRDPSSPLLGLLQQHKLGLIEEPAARSLITEPAASCGLDLSAHEVDHLLDVGGRFPFLLTLTCETYYNLRTSFEDAAKAQGQLQDYLIVRSEIRQTFMLLWNRCTAHEEQPLLLQVAAGASEVNPRIAAPLRDRGLIYLKKGTYHLFSTTFRLFLQELSGQHAVSQPSGAVHLNTFVENLSPVDRAVFMYLTHHSNTVCEFQRIQEAVWTEGDGTKRALEAAIHRLRNGLPAGHTIKNVRGRGYKYIVMA